MLVLVKKVGRLSRRTRNGEGEMIDLFESVRLGGVAAHDTVLRKSCFTLACREVSETSGSVFHGLGASLYIS